jgi:hypothetical protein
VKSGLDLFFFFEILSFYVLSFTKSSPAGLVLEFKIWRLKVILFIGEHLFFLVSRIGIVE